VGQQTADIADTLQVRDIAITFYICSAHWRHLVNMTEPSVWGSDVALCQTTL